MVFQSSPDPKAGRNFEGYRKLDVRRRGFQSSPDPEAGRNLI